MSRRYDEQIEVRWGAAGEHGVRLEGALPGGARSTVEVPTLFLWRGRVHVVRAVLARWTQRVPWWRIDPDAEVGAGTEVDTEVRARAEVRAGVEQIAVEGRADVDRDRATRPELERVVWRVEAGAGRSSGTGVYDLVQGERWRLDRVTD